MSAATYTQPTIDAAGLRQRATRMLALVDMARQLLQFDPDMPGDDESTDCNDRRAALLHCLAEDLQALCMVGLPDGPALVVEQATPAAAPVDSPADALPATPGAAATPLQLLQQLDGWLCNTGHDAAHPWRRSIAATLAAQWAEGPTVSAVSAGHLFWEISELVESLEELMQQCLNGHNELWPAAFSVVNHVGWLADSATVVHGADSGRKTVEQWFLSPRARGALQDAERATQGQGGAA